MSYLQKRVFDEMAVQPVQQKVKVNCPDRHGGTQAVEMDIFTSDAKDNIRILVYTLSRDLILYDHKDADPLHKNPNNEREQYFYITRLKEPLGDMKYSIPKGVGTYPFFPPALVTKYEAKEEIKTLVLTEGYFKAFKGSVHGFDIVGLSSITHYKNQKTKTLHPDIIELIKVCKVKNVVVLYDGDCLNISTKALIEKEDLARRPNQFRSSMDNMHELLKDFDVEIYFAHVLSENLPNKPKGLDDLLIDQKGKEADILEDLQNIGTPGQYIYRLNVSKFRKRLQQYFNLSSVTQFYGAWQDVIKETEFEYFGTKYKYDSKAETVIKTVPRELKNFMRVGDEYYEKIEKPTLIENEVETLLVKRAKGTITDDFGKNAIQNIVKYKAFINMPSHTNYQQVINNCYNRYAEFTHEPQEGDWTTIREFLNHIFQEHIEYGLDYIQILYQYPTQILPILCLVSKKRHTGKTTFLDFLKMIFGENAAKVGNSEISSQFNSFLASRLIVGVDETALENNKEITERIKMLSTSNRIFSQRKGVDHEEMLHFAKYILVSNNEDNFIYTQEDEIRFWVRNVPVIPKEKLNTEMIKEMFDEIPAFLYFLNNRKISTPKVSRAWFDPKQLETEALRKLKERNKPVAEKEIVAFVRNLFLDHKIEQQLLTIEALRQYVNLKRYEDTYLHQILRDNLQLKKFQENGKEIAKRFRVPRINPLTEVGENVVEETNVMYDSYHGRPYVFEAKQFLLPQELEQIFNEPKPDATEQEIPY